MRDYEKRLYKSIHKFVNACPDIEGNRKWSQRQVWAFDELTAAFRYATAMKNIFWMPPKIQEAWDEPIELPKRNSGKRSDGSLRAVSKLQD